MGKSGIYAITSPSGMAYIGSSKSMKMRRYGHLSLLKNKKHHSQILQNAWNKYGVLRFIVLEYCAVEKLIEREQWWIDNHQKKFVGIYNISLIAGRVEMTDETRAKLSAARKGKKRSPESIEKTAAANRGRKQRPETVAKRAESNRGQKRSLETKKKISDSMRGKSFSKGRVYSGDGLLALQQSASRARKAKEKKNG